MNDNHNNVIRFIPRPLEYVALQQLVQHGRYAAPLNLWFWLGGEEEAADDGEGLTIAWLVQPLPGNQWEVIKTTRTFLPDSEPEVTTESSGALSLDALRTYLAETPYAIGDDLFRVLETRMD